MMEHAADLELIPPARRPREQDSGRWQTAVLEVATAVLTEATPEETWTRVARAAAWLTDAQVATIGVPHTQGQSLVLRTAVGHRGDELRGSVFPVAESLSGSVMAGLQGLRIDDATAEANPYQPICELGDVGPALIVPLAVRCEAFGTLLAGRRRGEQGYTDDDLELLTLFADQATIAIEFGRTREELQRLAIVEERERIGRDLHDTVIQQLFAVGLHLQSVARRHEPRVPELSRSVDEAVEELNEIIGRIRSTIFDLQGG